MHIKPYQSPLLTRVNIQRYEEQYRNVKRNGVTVEPRLPPSEKVDTLPYKEKSLMQPR